MKPNQKIKTNLKNNQAKFKTTLRYITTKIKNQPEIYLNYEIKSTRETTRPKIKTNLRFNSTKNKSTREIAKYEIQPKQEQNQLKINPTLNLTTNPNICIKLL